MKNTLRTLALLLALGAGALGAQAQSTSSSTTASPRACRADFMKFCRGVKPGQGGAVACLREHQAELSSACQSNLDALQACTDQARTICGTPEGATPDRTAMRQCLKEHREEFSADCRAQLGR